MADYPTYPITKVKDLPTRLQGATVYFDTETTGLDKLDDKPFMLLMSTGPKERYAVEWSSAVAKYLNDVLSKIKLGVFHHAKYDGHMFLNGGVNPDIWYDLPIHDTYICEALLDEHRFTYGLDDLGLEYFNITKRSGELYAWLAVKFGGKADKSQMRNAQYAPRELVAHYGMGDLDLTERLFKRQIPLMKKEELEEVRALEMDALKALLEMERRGVYVNMARVGEVENQLQERFTITQKSMIDIVGFPVNPRSPLQMVDAFNKLGLPISYTKADNPSFNKEVLSLLDHPFIDTLQESRTIKTLLDTFINGSIKGHNRSGYIHTDFNQTRGDEHGTGTGRLSSTDPNLQQIPNPKRAETALQKEVVTWVRSLFYPERGHLWCSGDWEQFEFRMFAHYTKDPNLIAQYHKDPKTDFHQALADIVGKTRDKTKRINLGLVFGMGDGKLAQELKLPYTREIGHNGKEYLKPGPEAEALFNDYHGRFPYARKFLKMASNMAKQRGYVKTLYGRRIRFPGGLSTHKAGGLVFQGSSADIMKKKCKEINDRFRKTDVLFNLVVHDEFCASTPKEIAEETRMEIKRIMEDVPELRVPILADVNLGVDWSQAH
jgi:DNA polymerase I